MCIFLVFSTGGLLGGQQPVRNSPQPAGVGSLHQNYIVWF